MRIDCGPDIDLQFALNIINGMQLCVVIVVIASIAPIMNHTIGIGEWKLQESESLPPTVLQCNFFFWFFAKIWNKWMNLVGVYD